MMSLPNVSLSTGSFQNQAATVDALETASVPKTDGVKRRKRDMSVLLEQASSSEGVSSSGKGTRSCSAKANDKLRAFRKQSYVHNKQRFERGQACVRQRNG